MKENINAKQFLEKLDIETFIESMPFDVYIYDINGKYIYMNSKYEKALENFSDKLIGNNVKDIFDEKEVDQIIKTNQKVINEKKTIKFEKNVIFNNIKRSFEIYKYPIFNDKKEVIGIIGTVVDLTEIKNAKREIEKLVHIDAHTGLLNRRALYEHLNNREYGHLRSILIIDVDDFKQINDTYGHLQGDKVLIYISDILKEICNEDYVYRFGGDEFVIIFKVDTLANIVENKAKEILNIISKEDKLKNISVSIGIATCNCIEGKCKTNEYKLINRADLALYKAKSLGKNRYVVYDEKLEEEINFEINLVKSLKKSVLNDEIKLLYQPLYNMQRKLVGFEALFRWDNGKYRDLPIKDIVKIIENNNLIINIGNEITKKACLFSKKINDISKENITVYINMSTIQVMDENFANNVKNIINEAKVDPRMIGIEITETVLLENINENIIKLKKLKDIGISISLDDFGTGYTSFNYLVKLPLSSVKIDKSFIDGLDFSMDYLNIIRLIADSSHLLNLEIVAEGVETDEQLKLLKEMNIDYIQGYLFSRPLEENDAIELCKESL